MTMKLLNRSALVIRPRQPLADWVSQVAPQDAMPLEDLRREGTVYLIDEVAEEIGFEQAVADGWLAMFENELSAWDEFGDDWPRPLSRSQFEDWFDIEPQVLAFDLSEQALMRAALEL